MSPKNSATLSKNCTDTVNWKTVPGQPFALDFGPAMAVKPAAPPAKSLSDLKQFESRSAHYFKDVTPPSLTEAQLRNSRIVPSREDIIRHLPKGGICAEIGTQTGNFAKFLMTTLQPAKLHIYDIDYSMFDQAHFQAFIQQGKVELHRGDSSSLLGQQPDKSFDLIYVDGDHAYEGVVKDLQQAALKIKDDGWIVCNNYTVYSPLEKCKFGVCRAVAELCLHFGFEIIDFALHPWGYHNVALRKQGAPPLAVKHVENPVIKSMATTSAPATAATSLVAASSIGKLARKVGDDWKKHDYYDQAEQYIDELWNNKVWPFIHEANFSRVLDLAAGHGRNSEKLKQYADKIYVVDINRENIDFCRERFAGDSRFEFFNNDGCSLDFIPSNSISLVYCFDAMVHFDSDVVRAYLREFQRILQPGGLGFCHHSNYTKRPGEDVHNSPGWRNFMSEAMFAHYCAKEKLTVIKSQVIDWDVPQGDCLTLFKKTRD